LDYDKCLQKGKGVAKNLTKAVEHFKMSADQNILPSDNPGVTDEAGQHLESLFLIMTGGATLIRKNEQ